MVQRQSQSDAFWTRPKMQAKLGTWHSTDHLQGSILGKGSCLLCAVLWWVAWPARHHLRDTQDTGCHLFVCAASSRSDRHSIFDPIVWLFKWPFQIWKWSRLLSLSKLLHLITHWRTRRLRLLHLTSKRVRNLSGFNRTKLKQDGGNSVWLIQDLLQACVLHVSKIDDLRRALVEYAEAHNSGSLSFLRGAFKKIGQTIWHWTWQHPFFLHWLHCWSHPWKQVNESAPVQPTTAGQCTLVSCWNDTLTTTHWQMQWKVSAIKFYVVDSAHPGGNPWF